MNSSDFIFTSYEPPFADYWFKVQGDSAKELTEKYMEQSLITVTDVVYSMIEGDLGIKLLFPFNYRVDIVNNDELKQIILDKIKRLKDERYS